MDKKLTIVGAGGHAKVVIATALACGFNVSMIIDDDPQKWGKELFGIKIDGPISSFAQTRSLAFLAIGDNKTRKRLAEDLPNFEWITLIHPLAYVHGSVRIGRGTAIFAGSIIQPDATLGEHCIINTAATVDHDCKIGDFVHLAPGTNVAGGVTIEEGAFLGIGAKVVLGRHIGAWSVIGAGGVVLQDFPSHVVATGVPAKIKKETRKEK